mgnify:CR=1 FL=1
MLLENEQYRNRRSRKRKKRRKRNNRIVSQFLIIMLMIVLALLVGNKVISIFLYEKPVTEQANELEQTETIPALQSFDIDLKNLYSPYAILVDASSGTVISEYNSKDKIYPASLTKIMTAILAIENTSDLEQSITLPDEIFPPLYAQNASMAGFQPGEEVVLKDLLYGVMLPSGAECCIAFAEQIAGSEEQFVSLMNEKAKELGMEHTHFTNSTGLHDPDHYSTVEDISILLQYALKNDDFRAAFTSSRYSTHPSEQHPDGFTFRSTMFKYMDSTEVVGGEILGGKTGYTEEAGLCLASLAQINGKEYILVTAKANGTHQTEQFHILDAINVYNQIGKAVLSTY